MVWKPGYLHRDLALCLSVLLRFAAIEMGCKVCIISCGPVVLRFVTYGGAEKKEFAGAFSLIAD